MGKNLANFKQSIVDLRSLVTTIKSASNTFQGIASQTDQWEQDMDEDDNRDYFQAVGGVENAFQSLINEIEALDDILGTS